MIPITPQWVVSVRENGHDLEGVAIALSTDPDAMRDDLFCVIVGDTHGWYGWLQIDWVQQL
ncbi:MAG: hypothetical protein H0W24_02450 [Lysobacter sp.]|nr:hypothetical protein [Lysobacter sp.]